LAKGAQTRQILKGWMNLWEFKHCGGSSFALDSNLIHTVVYYQNREGMMKVFIAGATGVLGRRVVQELMAKGHQVVGLSRSAQNSDWLSQNGAIPREGSLFNPQRLAQISADCEATLHLATAIPTKTRTTAKDWALNDRIRREGTRNLVTAALRNHHKFYLQESITFIYGDRGADWVDETASLPRSQVDILQSAVDMERIVQQAAGEGLPVTVLRFGNFYSHDSAHTTGMFQMVKKRFFPVIGDGDFYWSLINVDDAAGAVVRAVEKRENCLNQTFNVCDDEPVLYKTYLEYVAATLGARRPFHIPRWLAKLTLGGSLVKVLTASVRCRNGRFKEMTGWEPRYPAYRQSVAAEVEKWLAQTSTSGAYTSRA
jgi:nucleoside-diphosphate-sugar epimerase